MTGIEEPIEVVPTIPDEPQRPEPDPVILEPDVPEVDVPEHPEEGTPNTGLWIVIGVAAAAAALLLLI